MDDLDKKDRRILFELDQDSRQSDRRIAKKIRLKPSTVRYRINRLVRKKVIKNFVTLINPARFGKSVFKLYLRLQDVTDESWDRIREYAIKHENVFWVTRYDGAWDVIIAYWAKTAYEFNDYYAEITDKFNSIIAEKQITNQIEVPFFCRKYLTNSDGKIKCLWGGKISEEKLDEIDYKILRILATNSRIASIDLARKINITERIVRYRIKELVRKQIILAFSIQLNQQAINYDYYKVMFYLKNMDSEQEMRFIEFCKNQGNILYYIKSLGPWELELEIETKNHKELNNILNQIRNNFGGIIRNIQTNLIIEEHKGEYNTL